MKWNEPYHWSEKPAISCDGWIVRSHWSFPIATLSTWSSKGITKRPNNQAFAMWVLSCLLSRGKIATEGPWPVRGSWSGRNSTCGSQKGAGWKCFPLLILFNESLATVVLPYEFKIGHPHPLCKPGKSNSKEASNYRGITLTCILSKVLEKLVKHKIYNHLESSGALSTSQLGFRRGHSCSELLLSVVDDLLSVRDSKLCVGDIFTELSKAFDNVDHQYIQLLLQKCRIGGTVLTWIQHFLEDRRQRIVLLGAGVKSGWLICNKGVPQGSVLGLSSLMSTRIRFWSGTIGEIWRCIDAVLCSWLHPPLRKEVHAWGWVCCIRHPWQCRGCSENERTTSTSFPGEISGYLHHTSIYKWHSCSDMQWQSDKNCHTSSASWSNRWSSAIMERTRKSSE